MSGLFSAEGVLESESEDPELSGPVGLALVDVSSRVHEKMEYLEEPLRVRYQKRQRIIVFGCDIDYNHFF